MSQDRELLERRFASGGLPAPVGAHAPEQRLAAAIFERAAADLEGRHVKSGRKLTRAERYASQYATEWVAEAGEGFQFWCDVAGRDWREVRRAMLRRHDRPHLRRKTRWLER